MSTRSLVVEASRGSPPAAPPRAASALLAYEESLELSAEERGLSLLSYRALDALARQRPLPADLADAARAVLEELPFPLLTGRFDMFEPAVRRALPAQVVESWRFFAGVVEARGLGQVHVTDLSISAEHDGVLLIHAVTYAGDGYLEVYSERGERLASGLTEEGRLSSWDEDLGDIRAVARALARR